MKRMTIEETKQVELDILIAFANFCDRHQLKYYLAYGTLIGALRHKGFIPWDDDIDVQMPREDYNRLIDIFDEMNTVEHIQLVNPNDKKARHSFVKLIDIRTVKIESGVDYQFGELGVDIDVFPIDGQPDSDNVFNRWYKKLHNYYQLYTYCVLKPIGSLKRVVGVAILRALINKRLLNRKINRLHAEYPYEQSKYVGAIESAFNSIKNRFEKECYSDHILVEFEGHLFKAPIKYDYILTKMYGNYMEFPPTEKQVTHHSNITYWRD